MWPDVAGVDVATTSETTTVCTHSGDIEVLVEEYALADPATLTPGAQQLRERVRMLCDATLLDVTERLLTAWKERTKEEQSDE